MPAISEIHHVAHQARDPDWTSYRNCGAINPKLRDALNEQFGNIAELIVGELAAKPHRKFGAEHAWVYIDSADIVEGTPVIVDGTLDQFSIGRWENGEVQVGLMPIEDFPRVSVIARSDRYNHDSIEGLYDHFIRKENYGYTGRPV